MSPSELADLSANILAQYYDNHVQPFFDYCHDDIFWIGPAQKQVIQTKEALVGAFMKEQNNLRFAVYDLVAVPLQAARQAVEVLLFFTVETFWPDGSSNVVDQRINLTWVPVDGEPRILLCHISNAIAYDVRDNIYPVHFREGRPQTKSLSDVAEKIHFNGIQKSILCVNPDEILYIESSGTHTIIHTLLQEFECTERLSRVAKRVEKTLLRCHSSFLVNPMYVDSIDRFYLTMKNGENIPVPEKKFTAVRSAILSRHGR